MPGKYKIFVPLSYLRIKNSQLIPYKLTIPLTLTSLFLLSYIKSPIGLNIFGENGLIDSINGLLGLLIGFYIASLAAVATFQNENLDKEIQGEKALLENIRGGSKYFEELTRRRFLCLLFGYCSFISIFLFLLGVFIKLFSDVFVLIIYSEYHFFLVILFLALYMFVFFNLIVTTLLGLYYLTDRIHRS